MPLDVWVPLVLGENGEEEVVYWRLNDSLIEWMNE
jgi:hypothetical protein